MVVFVIFLCLFIIVGINYIYYRRSFISTLVEIYLRINKKTLTEEELIAGLSKLPSINDVRLVFPKRYAKKCEVVEEKLDNMQVFIINGNNESIIYLHGAGYVRNPRIWHYRFVYKLHKRTGCTVIMPIYPKAPNHDYKECYRLMDKLYRLCLDKYNKVILMGDSSGGGLALGLCEYFIKEKIRQPDELILLSPWVDISLENPNIKKYEKLDPICVSDNDRLWGKIWANGLDNKNYLVSPLYGDMIGLKNVSIFVGTREILFPDIKLLALILLDSKVHVNYHIGNNMNHVYPIYPIPEARKAMKEIVKIIRR